MKIIYRYIVTEYLKILFYSLLTFTVIYFIVDFFERFDMFVKHKTETAEILKYFLFKLPFIIYQMLPIAVLLSTLLSIGIMSKNNEITAMKSGGISIYRISVPLIVIALFITLFSFVTSEYITPYTNMQVIRIKNRAKNKKETSFLKHDKIWYSGEGLIYNIDYFDAKTNKLHNVIVLDHDDEFRLIKRIDAATGLYKGDSWVLKDVSIREFSYKKGVMGVKSFAEFDETPIYIPETPQTLKEVRKKADEMSYNELKQFVAKIKSEGYEADEYEVDMHAKLSIPFVCVIMTIIGIPFALKRERSGSIAVGVGISLIIGFCYWIILSFALSLGHAGVLPPLVAAWVSLFIFLLIGAYMFSSIRQ